MTSNIQFELVSKLQETINAICTKFQIKSIDVQYKSMEGQSKYLVQENLILICKDYLENFYSSLHIVMEQLIKRDIDEDLKAKLGVLSIAFNFLGKKKLITPDIKENLINLGFREVNIGHKEIHKINSKELKLDFFGYDIAIGIYARYISYGCNRLYRAIVYNFN